MNRIDIYESALQNMLAHEDNSYGLCHSLLETVSMNTYGLPLNDLGWDARDSLIRIVEDGVWGIDNSMPEISKHKPTSISGRGYWPIDHARRVEILEQAIVDAKADAAAKEDWDANHYDGDSSQNE